MSLSTYLAVNDGWAGWSVFPNLYLLPRAAVGRWWSNCPSVPFICSHCTSCRLSPNPEMPFVRPRIWFRKLLQ